VTNVTVFILSSPAGRLVVLRSAAQVPAAKTMWMVLIMISSVMHVPKGTVSFSSDKYAMLLVHRHWWFPVCIL
jgi:hypothetical protein